MKASVEFWGVDVGVEHIEDGVALVSVQAFNTGGEGGVDVDTLASGHRVGADDRL